MWPHGVTRRRLATEHRGQDQVDVFICIQRSVSTMPEREHERRREKKEGQNGCRRKSADTSMSRLGKRQKKQAQAHTERDEQNPTSKQGTEQDTCVQRLSNRQAVGLVQGQVNLVACVRTVAVACRVRCWCPCACCTVVTPQGYQRNVRQQGGWETNQATGTGLLYQYWLQRNGSTPQQMQSREETVHAAEARSVNGF